MVAKEACRCCYRRLGATEPTTRILFYYFLLPTALCTPFAIIVAPFGLRGAIYLISALHQTLLVGQALLVLA